jgi:hypothetical protein
MKNGKRTHFRHLWSAPSDVPEFAEWLVHKAIDSISLNPDSAVKTAFRIASAEQHSLVAAL